MAPQLFDLVLMNGVVVNQDGEGVRDIGVRDGRIAEIGALGSASAGERIDCQGLHVLPGVIDSQVHFREPGLVHKEDLETGSRAAALGGVTAVFEMPNTRSDDDDGGRSRRQASPGEGPHALRLRLLGRRHARQCRRPFRARAPAGRRRDQGVHGVVDGKAARRRRCGRAGDSQGNPASGGVSQRGRGAPQRAKTSPRPWRPFIASRLARRNCRAPIDRAPRPPGPRGACAGAYPAYLHRPRDGAAG